MPHLLRPLDADLTLHVTAHALPGRTCFPDEDCRGAFRQLLSSAARWGLVDFHAYALMDNHLHLLLTTRKAGAIAQVMWKLLVRQTTLVNRVQGRRGPLWMYRYGSILIQEERHVLNSYLYIDSNPWRARVVEHPRETTWTSFLAHSSGGCDAFLVAHPVFQGLGFSESSRQRGYSDLMEEYLRVGIRFKSATHRSLDVDPLAGLRLTIVAVE